MNKSLITGLIVGGVAVTAVGAYAGYQTMDNRNSAQVLNVEPMTRTIKTARQVCDDVVVSTESPTNDPKRVTGAVMGAVVGGVLGNQIGGGTGQTVATVAGAAAGGYAGSKIQKHMQDGNTTQSGEQQCRTGGEAETHERVRHRGDQPAAPLEPLGDHRARRQREQPLAGEAQQPEADAHHDHPDHQVHRR